jgi:iron complex outermembrane receptor protein
MKKLLIILLAFSALAVNAQTKNTLQGTVTNSLTGDFIPGAIVRVTDFNQVAVSGNDGKFRLTNLPSGTVLVEVRMITYNTFFTKLEINGETKLIVKLEPSITEIHEVIITGVSQSTAMQESSIPVVLVSQQAMLESGASNLVESISKQPGITQITTGAAISKPVIRGLGYNRVVTLNNGMRQEGQQWGDEHGVEIDEYSIDRVEIIKGPGSLLYGSDAMAGVINFLPASPAAQGQITGNFLAGYQTNNKLQGYSANTAGNLNGIFWNARISGKLAGNYTNRYDGRVLNTGFSELNGNASVGVNRKWGVSTISFSRFDQRIGLPEGERDSAGNFLSLKVLNDQVEELAANHSDLNSYGIDFPKQHIVHSRLGFQNLLAIRKSRLQFNAAAQENRRKELADPLNPNAAELDFDLQTLNYDLRWIFPERKSFNTTIGMSGMQQSSRNLGEEVLIPAYDLSDIGGYLVSNLKHGKWAVSSGIRVDNRNIQSHELIQDGNLKFEAFNRTFTNISGSLGTTYSLGEHALVRLNFARGFRSPNAAELGSNGVHEGTIRYEYGNNRLKAETSFQADLGASIHTDHLSIDAALFSNSISNYIYLEKLAGANGGDSIPDPADPLAAFSYIQGNAVLNGGELSIDIHPHPLDWLHLLQGVSYVQASNLSKSGKAAYLPNIPPARYQAELRALLKRSGKRFQQINLFGQIDHWFAQNRVLTENASETPSQDYTLVNAGLNFSIKTRNQPISVYISVNNLLDVAYQNHLSRLRYTPENLATGRTGIWNMGRNISIKLMVLICRQRE